jgi:meso-butanediol dehydrogenase/(S,S)-butanediol dehydrogenase/diacetyl reductase
MGAFDEKVVIVTGAASGIGAATARRFAVEGASVVLVDLDRAGVEEVAAQLPGAVAEVVDLTDEQQVETLIAEVVEELGQLDVLVNNAGVVVTGDIASTSTEQWRKVMAADVDAVFFASRAALPHLARTRGCIVNTSSVSGIRGDWQQAAYDAAKGAVSNLTRAMALDHGADGIRVNAVAPGVVRTGMTEGAFEDDETMAKHVERIPLRRGGEPEDVADVIAFLAGEDARFVTGVVLPVDGGVSASNGQPA